MHIEPTNNSGRLLMERHIPGPVTMLNLLRFRDVADYADAPELAPEVAVSGERAYNVYAAHTLPFLRTAGGEVVFHGTGGPNFIGPDDERWDRVLLVRYPNIKAFLGMATNPEYLAGIGHRAAALEDSRLLPIEAFGA
jgi:uncharacterized protein (DUF1330 family)